MADILHSRIVSGPCPFCGVQRPLAAVYVVRKGHARRALAACALCVVTCVDNALGWRLSHQVRQAMAAQEAGHSAKASGASRRPSSPHYSRG